MPDHLTDTEQIARLRIAERVAAARRTPPRTPRARRFPRRRRDDGLPGT